MELGEALARISEIRGQMARTQVFRGYRSLPIMGSGLVAMALAAAQPWVVADPAANPARWLVLWIGAAILSCGLCGFEMIFRYRTTDSEFERQRIRIAVLRFLPSVAAGVLVTFGLWSRAPSSLQLLPGLWAILMALGVFASLDMLPRTVVLVAMHYLLAGAAALCFAVGVHAFAPLAMGLTFGLGQMAGGLVLYFTLERTHATKD